jgi:hypothetical protein
MYTPLSNRPSGHASDCPSNGSVTFVIIRWLQYRHAAFCLRTSSTVALFAPGTSHQVQRLPVSCDPYSGTPTNAMLHGPSWDGLHYGVGLVSSISCLLGSHACMNRRAAVNGWVRCLVESCLLLVL